MTEIKVISVRKLSGSSIPVTTGELRFFKNNGLIKLSDPGVSKYGKGAYFVSPLVNSCDQNNTDYEYARPGELAVNKFGEVVQITQNDSPSFVKSCLRVLVMPNQIPSSIQSLIESGDLEQYNHVSIEVELVIETSNDDSNIDDVYHKIKFDQENKVNIVSYETFPKNKKTEIADVKELLLSFVQTLKLAKIIEGIDNGEDEYRGITNEDIDNFIKEFKPVSKRATNNDLLQLMHDTMSPVNTIKGATFHLKPLIESRLEENKGDEFLSLLLKMMNSIEGRANHLNEVLDAYYVNCKNISINSMLFKPQEFTPESVKQAIDRSRRGKYLLYLILKTSSPNVNRQWVVGYKDHFLETTDNEEDAKTYEDWKEAAREAINLKKLFPDKEFTLQEL